MLEKIEPDRNNPEEMALLRERTGNAGAGAPNKFDINLASAQLLDTLGFAEAAVTQLRAGRPYFSLADAARAPGLDAACADRLRRWFMVTPLVLDAAGGQGVTTLAAADEWVIRDDVGASGEAEGAGHAYRRVRGRPERGRPGRHTFPAYHDDSGAVRYLDPQYLAVQARCGVEDPGLEALLQQLNLQVYQRLPAPGLFVARVGGARHGPAAVSGALAALQGSPLVELAEPAWIGFDDLAPGDIVPAPAPTPLDTEDAGDAWHLASMNAAALWQLGRGSPEVLLACVDTGVDATHPALAAEGGALRASLDFSGTGGGDDNGHGTGVAGLMVGARGAAAIGLAPGCSLLSLKVLLQTDVASYASRRAALLELAARARAGRKIVVNLSWKTTGDVAIIRTAIEALAEAGALVVCSAGNDGDRQGAPHYPSDYVQAVSVAAVDRDGTLAGYSNMGPAVDLVAPGGSAAAPLPCCAPGGREVGRIGTSYAAPQIAAAAALAWSARPSWSAAQVRAAVAAACGPGAGMPDLARLARHLEANAAPAPAAWPMAGAVFAAAAQDCRLPAITQRILAARPSLSGWDEVARVLGMDPARLACLQARLERGA